MIRIWNWANTHYQNYQGRKQRRGFREALNIIPPDASPEEIIKAWKNEKQRRHERIRDIDCATPTLKSFPFWSWFHKHSRNRATSASKSVPFLRWFDKHSQR